MAIDITKEGNNNQYYYSASGTTLGPFTLAQLLEKVEADTLVYREGISWTNAKDVEELKKFFKVNSVPNNFSPGSTQLSEMMPDLEKPKRMFAAPFSFDGRIRRTEYGLSFILFWFSFSFFGSKTVEIGTIGTLYLIAVLWFIIAQGAKRCHDRGNSGLHQIIPFYTLWMIFAEGEKKSNDYGPPPK